MHNQKKYWNNRYKNNSGENALEQSKFSKEVLKLLNPASKVLELGCGTGFDSVAFAKNGHTTFATDFSEFLISSNSEKFNNVSNLIFEHLDISSPMEFEKNEFDLVYARLSLHYFTDKITRKIFNEIYRVLKPNGYLCFLCKSVDDRFYGKGEKLEKDFFEYKGHVRHFFSKKFVKECLGDKFEIKKMEYIKWTFDGKTSSFIKVIASSNKHY